MGDAEPSRAQGDIEKLSNEDLIRRFCTNRERLKELEKTPASTRTDPMCHELAEHCAINEQLGTELWDRHRATVYGAVYRKAFKGRRCPRSYTRNEFADESFSAASVNFLARICRFKFQGPIVVWLTKLAYTAVYDTWRSIEQVRGSEKSIVLKRIQRCLPESQLRNILKAYIASESPEMRTERATVLRQIEGVQKAKDRLRRLAVLMVEIMPEERVSELLQTQEAADLEKKRPKAPKQRLSLVSIEDIQTDIPDKKLEDASQLVSTIDFQRRLKGYADASDENAESVRVFGLWTEGFIPREIAERDYGQSITDGDARVQQVRRKLKEDLRGLSRPPKSITKGRRH